MIVAISVRIMSAVVVNAALHRKPRGKRAVKKSSSEPVSFHLTFLVGTEYTLPEGKNSVHILRAPFFEADVDDSPFRGTDFSSRLCCIGRSIFSGSSSNITGTRMEFWTKKFNAGSTAAPDFENTWQDRLIIVTEKRVFIVTRKLTNNKGDMRPMSLRPTAFQEMEKSSNMEIVDSIPMEEISSVVLDDDTVLWSEEDHLQSELTDGAEEDKYNGSLSRYLLSASSLWKSTGSISDNATRKVSGLLSVRGLRESLAGTAARRARAELFCPSVLRISTIAAGFNHGQDYYFLVRKDGHRLLDAGGGEVPATGDDAGKLSRWLAALAERRRGEHASETLFLRMQQRLQAVWDSLPFNMGVLVLIVSNFVFTVEQVHPGLSPMVSAAVNYYSSHMQ